MKYTKTILQLAVPAIIESLLQSTLGFVDTLFISRLGLEEVAAVGISNNILQVYFAIFLAIGTTSTVFASRASGEGDVEKVKKIVSHSLVLAITIGGVLGSLSLLFAEDILRIMGADAGVATLGTLYFRVVGTTSILTSLMFTTSALLRGIGDTRTPMRVGLWMNAIHILLDYILIFGVFFEGFGVQGAAYASGLARFFGVVFLIHQLFRKNMMPNKRHHWKIENRMAKGLLKLGFPAALERLSMRLGQIVYFGMIIRMGTDVYAAHTLAGNFTIFASVVGSGLATATTTLIGQSIGARRADDVKKYSKTSIRLTILLMTSTLGVTFLFSGQLAPLFTENAVVISLITIVLAIDLVTQPATAIVTSLTATLQAGGDTRFPMYVTTLGIWLIRAVGVYLLGVRLELGIVGVWVSILIDNYVRAVCLFIRYRSSGWMRIIELDEKRDTTKAIEKNRVTKPTKNE